MNKLTKYTNTGFIQKTNEIVDEFNGLARVASTGSYNDLKDIPSKSEADIGIITNSTIDEYFR